MNNNNLFIYLAILNLIFAILFIFIQVGYVYLVITNIGGWICTLLTSIENK